MRKYYCPKCQRLLVVSKTGKAECPNPDCDFVDRRKGRSMVSDAMERRGVVMWETARGFKK
jgi:uncharacterized Zn finger protein (UPF0148 family)